MSREKYGFLLFNFPSDHEVDNSLSTECDTIYAILHNRDLQSRLKMFRATSSDSVKKFPVYVYKGIKFVHLAGHGSKSGLSLIGDRITWKEVAEVIKLRLKPLRKNDQRVLCISSCYSRYAFDEIKIAMRQYFSGCYYFSKNRIGFATAITTWSMFYLRKTLEKPQKKIVNDINSFFGDEVIIFADFN